MCKKLIVLTSFLLVLGLIGSNVVFADVIEVRVAAGEDDAEEKVASGDISLTSSDLEITEEGSPEDNQLVGMRFNDIAIPQGAIITSAYVQFQVDETDVPGDNRPGTKVIKGEASDNAAAFTDAAFDISSRPTTSAEASWDWPEWLTEDEEGPDQQTSDISAVIQEIVDQPGWASGNALVLIITGSGENAAESFDGEAESAPLLHVEFASPTMITVSNAGFEDPVLAADDWSWLEVSGWTWVGGEGPGIWHVTSADFDPVVAPEGQNVLYTENAVGDGGGVAQVLTATFAADTDYTLTVEVGNSNYYYFAGYSVQLLAGETVIAEDNDTLWPDYMSWATSTVQYTYDPADSALVGQPLEIRLLNLGLDKDSPPDNTVGVEFDNVTLSSEGGAEPGVTIPVEEGGDIAAANELANAGDTIEIAAGTYILSSQIEIKDGVTYKGAGQGLTIIDGNDVTRAFAGWGDRSVANGQVDENGNVVPNNTGPKGWVLEGMTIQNCVADSIDRQDVLSSARDLLNNYTGTPYTLVAAQDENTGIAENPDAFELLSGGADDDLTDVELQAYLDNNPVGSDGHLVLDDDKNRDGGAISVENGAVGTIQNCDFLNNYTPADGDDGGAININGRSTVTINDCLFNGNYACSPDSVSIDGADGDAGHIKAQGNNLTNGFVNIGTTLIINRCVFLNGNAEDDAGAIQANAQGIVIRIDSCWFEGNTAWDNGTVLQFPNEDQNEATVTNCVFVNNITKADNSPDRMIETRRNSKFINCTFVGNVQEDQDLIYNNANNADGDHDGVDDEMADVTQVINCLFLNNVVGGGDDVLGSRNDNFSIAATNCLFFGNTLQNGDPADNTQRPGVETGSLLSDPLLDADLVPGVGSEAIDGGVDPATVGANLTTDYNGDARPKGAAYDIGAFEVE